MAQVLHKRATTTHLTRQYIINSSASVQALANQLGISPSTVQKWRTRGTIEDKPMGNGRANSVLQKEEEELICKTRQLTWFALDDLLLHLKPAIPKLTRSNLHRCLQYYGLSKVPDQIKPKREKKTFKSYEIGFIHIDITEFYLQKKKWNLYVAIDRTSKVCYAQLFASKTNQDSLEFLKNVLAFFPYKIHRILTDNGKQFTYRSLPKKQRPPLKRHPFTQLCYQHHIKHKLTPFYSPQTNGQVERMNLTIKEATLHFFHYETIQQFKHSLAHFLNYYNCKKGLKSLKQQTPYEYVISQWKKQPKLFHKNPYHHCVGLNT